MSGNLAIKLEPIFPRSFTEPDRAQLQEEVINAVQRAPEVFLDRYVQNPYSHEGRFINSDLMKEVFPEYGASPESRNRFNTVVHNSAAVLASAQYTRVVTTLAQPNQTVASFITGIPGAGKTTFVLDAGRLRSDQHLIYEGQLSNTPQAIHKLQQAIDASLRPEIVVVHMRPEQAFHNTLNRQAETGRGASIEAMARIQGGLPSSLQALHSHFADSISLIIVDRRDELTHRLIGWENLPVLTSEGSYEQIKHRLSTELDKLTQAGLSDAAIRQARGQSPDSREDARTDPGRMDRRSDSEAQRPDLPPAKGLVDGLEQISKDLDNLKQTVKTANPFHIPGQPHAEFLMDAICGQPQGRNYLNQISNTVERGDTRAEPLHNLGSLTIQRAANGELSYAFTPNPAHLTDLSIHIANASTLAHNKSVLLRKQPTTKLPEQARQRSATPARTAENAREREKEV